MGHTEDSFFYRGVLEGPPHIHTNGSGLKFLQVQACVVLSGSSDHSQDTALFY